MECRHHHRHRPGRRGADSVGAAGRPSGQRVVGQPRQGRHHAGRAAAGHRQSGRADQPDGTPALAQPGQRRRGQRADVRGIRRHQGAAPSRPHSATADRLARPRPGDRLRAAGRAGLAAGDRARPAGLAPRPLRPVRQPDRVAAARTGASGGQAAVRDPGRTVRSAHPDPGRRRGRLGDLGQQRRRASGRWRHGRQRGDRWIAAAAGRGSSR